MIEVIDHTSLIHPVRNASELVKKSMLEDFIEIDMSEWRPLWVKQVSRDIAEGKYGGLVVPEINFGVFHTNTLLKSASGYHELNGHINSLMTNASSKISCVKYHSALTELVCHKKKEALKQAIDSMVGVQKESITQELIANTAEINVLTPYVQHKCLGKKAEKRIKYLENLGGDKDWFCDMCAGPLCTHQSSMYLRTVLSKDLGLSVNSIADLAYGFSTYVTRKSDYPKKFEAALSADSILLETVQRLNQSKSFEMENKSSLVKALKVDLLKDEILNDARSHMPMSDRQFFFQDHIRSAGEVFYLKPYQRNHIFQQDMKHSYTDACDSERKLIKEFFVSPLCDLIAKSFVVATKQSVLLFVAKDAIPKEEKMQIRSLDVLMNLKALIIETYGYANQLVKRSYLTCNSRNGSRCFFKEKLEIPNFILSPQKTNYVFDSLLNNKNINLTSKNLMKSLQNLSKLRLRNDRNNSSLNAQDEENLK